MTDETKQGTQEWLEQRLGKVTASRISDVVSTTKSGAPTAGRANYMAQLVTERMTGEVQETYVNAAMQHGTDTEPQARAAYEVYTGLLVMETGFVEHPDLAPLSGASPDGLVGDDGLVEMKCPNTATHINTLLSGNVPSQYLTQIQWQMACTGRKWCDFVSFDPRMPPNAQLFIKRVERDDALIDQYTREVKRFLSELNQLVAKVAAFSIEE